MLFYIDIDERPDADDLADLDDEELGEVLDEAMRAQFAAEDWWFAANEELAQRQLRRARANVPLFERLRSAEQRRLERRRRKKRRR
jgi:hypothetical protein